MTLNSGLRITAFCATWQLCALRFRAKSGLETIRAGCLIVGGAQQGLVMEATPREQQIQLIQGWLDAILLSLSHIFGPLVLSGRLMRPHMWAMPLGSTPDPSLLVEACRRSTWAHTPRSLCRTR